MGKFIDSLNRIFGDKQVVQKVEEKEVVKETLPTTENKGNETISFQNIKSYFFKKKDGNVLNTQTTVTSTTTTKIVEPKIKVFAPVQQLKDEHYTVKSTVSGIQYEEKQILLKATGINLSFGKKRVKGKLVNEKIILRDVNLEIRDVVRPNVQQGQVVAIVGQSGMGKSQLFKILAGLSEIPREESEILSNRELSGQVLIGRDLKDVQAGDVGVITQDYLMFNHRTIQGNFELSVAKNKSLSDNDKKNLISMYVDKFNLTEHLDKYPLQLSGGQQQRAAIIQQIVRGNDYLLLDEPFSGLDFKMIEKTLAVLSSISMENEDRTLIIVSHDISTACSISDHVFILGMEEGKPGATIKRKIDLMERDLAWHDFKTIRKNPAFLQTIEEIESLI